ncbi:SRPBCC family protein [Marinilongibacter aquaticus]|uniref:SRPBCC family protein n=1 Tax=Marinilongibacter aquaticus TaxID=2975157 RepID=UPI0021BD47F7|nr:SRPBCC family protein [Marinilongibacter aquaticus]UBM60738.1 SRPBCC family protein [Marinilongibacter aquaticus]
MLKFHRHSGIYTLETQTVLPLSIEEVWLFFSDPQNLQAITPPYMGFEITSAHSNKAYTGQIISYRVGILPKIKTNWVTEITHVNEPYFFVDEQRFGPYSMWHHEHHFARCKEGVCMTDKVSFKIPLGILGHLAYTLFIKAKLTEIFSYRTNKLKQLFT